MSGVEGDGLGGGSSWRRPGRLRLARLPSGWGDGTGPDGLEEVVDRGVEAEFGCGPGESVTSEGWGIRGCFWRAQSESLRFGCVANPSDTPAHAPYADLLITMLARLLPD